MQFYYINTYSKLYYLGILLTFSLYSFATKSDYSHPTQNNYSMLK